MRANSFGKQFGITTFGESHCPVMGLVFEDIKPNIDFPFEDLNTALQKRKPAEHPHSSQRNENDDYEIISGIFNGKTTGMPICIIFRNKDAKSDDYDLLKEVFRPGHADYSWYKKFKIFDYRGGGRASGRETISRVAAGALVKEKLGDIKIQFNAMQIGELDVKSCSDDQIMSYLQQIKAEKDSVGAVVEVRIINIPAGLGDPVFEKLDANLAKAIMSIPAVKGIEFGDGFALSSIKGSVGNDQQNSKQFFSNHQGGIVGGVSNGNDIILRLVVRAPSSIAKPQKALKKEAISASPQTDIAEINITGRHDVCLVPRIFPVIESMIQLVLADATAYQEQITQKKQDLSGFREIIDKIDEDILIHLYKRQQTVNMVKEYKKENNIPLYDEKREQELIQKLVEIGKEFDISEKKIRKVWKAILS